jgi:multidrug efflux system membrane fusion protein
MSKSTKILLSFLSLCLIIGGGWWYKQSKNNSNSTDNKTASTSETSNNKSVNNRRNRNVPAMVDKASANDVPVIVTALGTITANNQATVRVRVDGLIESINFKEGSLVKAGDIIAKLDNRAFKTILLATQGQLKKDLAQLNIAKLDLERYKNLFAENSIAKQQVDTQSALVKQLEGNIDIDNANIESAKLNLSFTNVTAPISGRIGLKQIDAGNMARTSDTNGIATITQIQPIIASFSIPQENLALLIEKFEQAKQQGKDIIVEAKDRDNVTVIEAGKLIAIDNQTDASTGSIKIKAQFENKSNKLFTGQFVNINVILDMLKGVTTVMQSAVQKGNAGSFVYKVNMSDKKAVMTKVKLGVNFGERVVVDEGIAIGDTVVVDGLDKLRDGAVVSIANEANIGDKNRDSGEHIKHKHGEGKGNKEDVKQDMANKDIAKSANPNK